MNINNAEPMTQYIDELVEQKHASGFAFTESERLLRKFSSFCKQTFPGELGLTKEMTLSWLETAEDSYSRNYKYKRGAAVNHLGRYMRAVGITAYILPLEFLPNGKSYYTPYILSKAEIVNILKAADNLEMNGHSKIKRICVPVALRLLYCCGLRPCELRKLKVEDVNLDTGELRILQSKGPKDRIVVMSEDMTSLCIRYSNKINTLQPGRQYFFQSSQRNDCYSHHWPGDIFTELLSIAGIPSTPHKRPRLYDLRHTFATHCIQNWIDAGEDINAKLSFLSAYMGHEDIESTAYYIHLISGDFHKRNSTQPYWYSALSGGQE